MHSFGTEIAAQACNVSYLFLDTSEVAMAVFLSLTWMSVILTDAIRELKMLSCCCSFSQARVTSTLSRAGHNALEQVT